MKVLLGVCVVAMVAACGGDDEDRVAKCTTLCQQQASCDTPTVAGDQCGSVCASNDAISKKAGCDKQYDTILSCIAGLADVCDTPSTCGSDGPGIDWTNCISAYCNGHRGETGC